MARCSNVKPASGWLRELSKLPSFTWLGPVILIAPCFCSWTVLFKLDAPYCTIITFVYFCVLSDCTKHYFRSQTFFFDAHNLLDILGKKTHVSISLSHYQSAKALRWTHLTAMHPATTSISQAITYVFEEHISRSWKMTNLFSQQPNQISSFPCGEVHRSNACNHADKWHKDWSTGIDDMESWYAKSRWFPPQKKSRTPRLFFKVNLPWKKHKGDFSEKT